MFCTRTTRDEGVKFIFETDGEFGLVAICNLCVRDADKVLREEEAKHVKFTPGGANGKDPTERDR